MAKYIVGFIGCGGDFDIVACGSKGLVGVQGDEQKEAGCDGVGREAEEEELYPTIVFPGNGSVAENELHPPATVTGETAQAVGIAGHAEGAGTVAKGLPHEP